MDMKLAVYIAMHSAVRSIDHLTDILKVIGVGSKLETIRLHRTKCSKLITNVIAPVMLKELVADVADSGYSLIIDESTDISVMKFLALIIRFHSKTMNKMRTEFLGLLEVYRATANALHASTKEYLASVGLILTNCIGLGSDGGNSLCGKHHSVYALFKQEVSLLQSRHFNLTSYSW